MHKYGLRSWSDCVNLNKIHFPQDIIDNFADCRRIVSFCCGLVRNTNI